MLYDIFPYAPRSILDKAKQNFGPHADGSVGSTQGNSIDLLEYPLQQLSIQQTAASQTSSLAVPPNQMLDVHSVQLSKPKANQQTEGTKKQWNTKGKGYKKANNNASEGKTEKIKSKYLCNPTHLCPRLAEAHKLLAQKKPVVLTSPFPHE
jgi:hypothetical protein